MAYFYIINPLAGGKRYHKLAEMFRKRLGELGIPGEFAIATAQDDLKKLAQIGVDNNFSSIVAVGGNDTVNAVLGPLVGQEKIALGIVPFGHTNTFSNMIGIRNWKEALDVLAGRRVETVDVGFLGDQPFLTQIFVSPKKAPISPKLPFTPFVRQNALSNDAIPAEIEIDTNYRIYARVNSVAIALALAGQNIRNSLIEGKLKLKIFSKNEGFSFFSKPNITACTAKKLLIQSAIPLYFTLDGTLAAQTPSSIAIAPKSLRLIVGKETFGRKSKLVI